LAQCDDPSVEGASFEPNEARISPS
jgi:hypothetical protein